MLVVRRKSGQSILVSHGGEEMRIKVSSPQGRNVTLMVEGPETFRVQRLESVEGDSLVGSICFVEDGQSRYRQAEVVRIEGCDYVVRFDDGVVRTVPKKTVQIVTKVAPDSRPD